MSELSVLKVEKISTEMENLIKNLISQVKINEENVLGTKKITVGGGFILQFLLDNNLPKNSFGELLLKVFTTDEDFAEKNELFWRKKITGRNYYQIMDPKAISQLKKGHLARFYFLVSLLKFIEVGESLGIDKIGSDNTNQLTARVLSSQYGFEKLGEKKVLITLEKLKNLKPKYLKMLAEVVKNHRAEISKIDPNSAVILE